MLDSVRVEPICYEARMELVLQAQGSDLSGMKATLRSPSLPVSAVWADEALYRQTTMPGEAPNWQRPARRHAW